MATIKINLRSGISEVYIVQNRYIFRELIQPTKTIVITDKNLYKLYHSDWEGLPTIVLNPGERSKSLSTIKKIYSQLKNFQVDRKYTILGWGGGVITDIAGFCAATYLRGLDYVAIATSLLAQVDASIGGKNGVNFYGTKNIIGTIYQPRSVICPIDVLTTLPYKHFTNGLAEAIKVAISGDLNLLEIFLNNAPRIFARELDILLNVITKCLQYKARIVELDERESNLRRVLNFGHTFGHAIEMATGMLHGYAIAIGMIWAAKISQVLTGLSQEEIAFIENIIKRYKLPTKVHVQPQKIIDLIQQDKKREGQSIHFIALKKLGESEIIKISYKELIGICNDLHLIG